MTAAKFPARRAALLLAGLAAAAVFAFASWALLERSAAAEVSLAKEAHAKEAHAKEAHAKEAHAKEAQPAKAAESGSHAGHDHAHEHDHEAHSHDHKHDPKATAGSHSHDAHSHDAHSHDAHHEHDPVDHIIDHAWVKPFDTPVGKITIMSKHIFVQLLVAAILIMLLPTVFGRPALVPRGLRNGLEAVCVFLRESVARPQLGEHTDRFIPYLWTLFFFILGCNLMGLGPFMATPTANIWMTATLAVLTVGMIVVSGLLLQGTAYIEHFFPGPLPLKPLIGTLEILGVFTKAFALAVRLFANMLAGHILLDVLISLVGKAYLALGNLGGSGIALVVIPACIGVMCLELFVTFLQAFVFTFLTALFLGQAVNIAHHGEHDEHGHDAHGEHGHAAHAHGKPQLEKSTH